MLIDGVTAIPLVSPQPRALADFYRSALDLPLEDEEHPDGFPGGAARHARRPVIVLGTSHLRAVTDRLTAPGVAVQGPSDNGFGRVAAFRDPDGHLVEILEEYRQTRDEG